MSERPTKESRRAPVVSGRPAKESRQAPVVSQLESKVSGRTVALLKEIRSQHV
ncbi:hypothetical protein [Pontibacillus salipaludis]|uniref:Chromosome partitioning protein ParB n=1 Tax=Pontibacillus salipaludis TaxID=1697394 RepID=A0ABQ1PVL5_9BACI|nr:hypothetical protein [Pontibacillus salipaludis]GGD04745.1 hypothetical protein GCM10011389_10330 [Pontibacillus salipaludis]